MKNLGFTILLFFLAFAVCAQPEMNMSADELEIKKLSSEWMTATMNRDEKTLNRIVAPEFILGGTDIDKPEISREMWIKNTMENLVIDSTNYIKMRIDAIDNMAIVRSTFYWSVSFREMPAQKDTVDLVDTWLKRNQNWQVVSRLVVDK